MGINSRSRVALIPARGGSKRLPRKNIIDFYGKPIIAYTIHAAKESKLFERVVVSTEDAEIADIACDWGAEIHWRKSDLATDDATVSEVCLDFINQESHEGKNYEILSVLYATAPLRTSTDIENVINLVKPGICDYALAITQYDLPPHQALMYQSNGKVEPMWPELVTARSESIPPLKVDNGSTYAVSIAAFRTNPSFYGDNMCGYVMPRERSIDIDTWEDYYLALYYAERMGP